MELSNTTGQDTKYKVASSGGSGMAPHGHGFKIEEAAGWPSLPSGSRIHYSPKSSGPWTVYFVVRGQGLVAKAESASDNVTLVEGNGGFQVLIS